MCKCQCPEDNPLAAILGFFIGFTVMGVILYVGHLLLN